MAKKIILTTSLLHNEIVEKLLKAGRFLERMAAMLCAGFHGFVFQVRKHFDHAKLVGSFLCYFHAPNHFKVIII